MAEPVKSEAPKEEDNGGKDAAKDMNKGNVNDSAIKSSDVPAKLTYDDAIEAPHMNTTELNKDGAKEEVKKPDNEPVTEEAKKPDNDLAKGEVKKPDNDSAKEDSKKLDNGSAKEEVKKPDSEPAKETNKESAKEDSKKLDSKKNEEPAKEDAKKPDNESNKEATKEPAKEDPKKADEENKKEPAKEDANESSKKEGKGIPSESAKENAKNDTKDKSEKSDNLVKDTLKEPVKEASKDPAKKKSAITSNKSSANSEKRCQKSCDQDQKSKKTDTPGYCNLPPIDGTVDNINAELKKIESLPLAKVCFDELALDRFGFRFKRIAISCTNVSYVYQAQGMSADSMVCKVIVLNNINPVAKENLLNNSVRIMRYLCKNEEKPCNPAFIRVYEIFQIENKLYFFVSELQTVSLLDMIKKKDKFTQGDGRKWMRQICDATQYIHQRGIAHRAIKIDHILFDKNKNAKLSSWSHSVIYYSKGKIILHNKEGKSFENSHLSPEAFEKPYDPARADNWSLGVLLVATHIRRYAFNVKSRVDFGSQWKTFVRKHEFNTHVLNLLNSIFVTNPEKRISVAQMLKSSYFSVAEDELRIHNNSVKNPEIIKAETKESTETETSTEAKADAEEANESDVEDSNVALSKQSSTKGGESDDSVVDG